MTRFRRITLKAVALSFVALAALFATFGSMRIESARQRQAVDLLIARDAGYWEFEKIPQRRFGSVFGFEYPADRIRAVKHPARSDWGIVPGWNCTDQDLQLLHKFDNLEEVYLSDSTYTNVGLQELAALANVVHIEFRSCDLTHADVPILAAAPRLERLHLHHCKLPMGAKERISQLVPQCEVYGSAE